MHGLAAVLLGLLAGAMCPAGSARHDPHDGGARRQLFEATRGGLVLSLHETAPESTTSSVLALPGVVSMHRLSSRRKLFSVTVAREEDMAVVTDEIKRMDGTLFVEPDWPIEGNQDVKFTDPEYVDQWALENINLGNAWTQVPSGQTATVCIVDSGIDYTHVDLQHNLWVNEDEIPGNGIDDDLNGWVDDVYGYDFHNNDADPYDDHSHGTHIAGVIGATADNGLGIVGISSSVKLMACKAMDYNLQGVISSSIKCVDYCLANGANVLSFSWGSFQYSYGLDNAIRDALDADAVVVSSAGNVRNNNDEMAYFPACYPSDNIITVASVGASDQMSPFSNYGKLCVDMAAPGEGIVSTYPGNTYGHKWGTSQSVPHVVGAAALLKAKYPGISYDGIKLILMDSVNHLKSLEDKCVSEGKLDVTGALSLANFIGEIGFGEYKRQKKSGKLESSA